MKIDRYTVTLAFTNAIIGGIPAVEASATAEERAAKYEPWIAQQVNKRPAEDKKDVVVEPEEVALDLSETEGMPTYEYGEVALTSFRRHQGVPAIEARQVKAMLKESAQRLGFIKSLPGMRQVLQHDVRITSVDGGDFICLGVKEVTGVEERPVHVWGPQGPQNSIKAYEYVDGAEVTFKVSVLSGGVAKEGLTEPRLQECLQYAEVFGALGADRSQGYGRFSVKEVIKDA